jgi:hypothetical protein
MYDVYYRGKMIACVTEEALPELQKGFLCFVDDRSKTVVLL